MIAALYVQTNGAYYGLDDVDPWDEQRDARLYDGPYPVVAHPPCSRWCQLASVNQARWGAMIGDDNGTFAAALAAVRRWGGVLEHPAYSLAWYRYHLPVPGRHGWTLALDDPGMSTEISQVAYGHDARKRTWLYAVGVDPSVVDLDWREPPAEFRIGASIHSGDNIGRRMMGDTLTTPAVFRDVLLDLARTVQR